jgi:hypothetical protein
VDVAAFGVVAATTIEFLQVSLEGDVPTVSLGALGNQRPAIARMFVGANGPSMTNVKKLVQRCGPN